MSEEIRKQIVKLILAGSDMDQAAAAARELIKLNDQGVEEVPLRRALETALVVCYMRPFTASSSMAVSSKYIPKDPPDSELHTWLWERRHKAYAHTDAVASGRTASAKILSATQPGGWEIEFAETWIAIPPEMLEPFIDFFERQQGRFFNDAADLQRR
ncbi:MAG: hypothetical protein WBB76_10005 [Gaiellaceae bacterium]